MSPAHATQLELVAAAREWRDAKLAVSNQLTRDPTNLNIPPKLMIRLHSAEMALLSAAIDLGS